MKKARGAQTTPLSPSRIQVHSGGCEWISAEAVTMEIITCEAMRTG